MIWMGIATETYRLLAGHWARLTRDERQELLESSLPLEFSYNSGRIENEEITLHDTREIFNRGRVVSFTGDVRTLFEIQNLRDAWTETLRLADSDGTIGVPELLHLHHTLTKGTYDERRWDKGERPGSFKVGDYVVASDIGYDAGEVPGAVEELLSDVSDALKAHDDPMRGLRIACFAHAKLVEIHPFADGNGRSARALQCVCLLRSGLPPLVIRESDRMAYYGALDAFHDDGSLDEFVDFCAIEAVGTWPDLLEAACERVTGFPVRTDSRSLGHSRR